MLGCLRKRQNELTRTVLALFIVGCLNLTLQSAPMAAAPNDCHDSSAPSLNADLSHAGSADLGTSCIHCPDGEPFVDGHESDSLYICAAMAACIDDVRHSAIVTAELKQWAVSGSSFWLNGAEPSAYKRHPQSTNGAPPPSLNIHYCRFLI